MLFGNVNHSEAVHTKAGESMHVYFKKTKHEKGKGAMASYVLNAIVKYHCIF